MSLPRFGVTRPVPVNLLMVALLVAGTYAGLTLRREFFPEIDPEAASVSLPYPGATPEEIEDTLAIKVEDALADLDEVDVLRTTISEGGGGIIVEFREGSDVRRAVDEVEREIDALTDLPEDAEEIRVSEFEARLPAIMVTVHGDVDEQLLKRTIRGVKSDLERLPGMGEILISGVREYEVRVDVDGTALLEQGISLPQVAGAIRAWMADVPGGSVRGETGTVKVRTLGVQERAEAIRDIVLRADGSGRALRVGDIAEVTDGFVDEQLLTRFDGAPSASLTVFKLGDRDIVQMAEMTRAYVAARRGEAFHAHGLARYVPSSPVRLAYEAGQTTGPLPPGVSISKHSDLARFVEGRLELLTKNAIYGAILVFATLLLFLNWRVAFWVGVGLATALAGTLIVMQFANITLNLLTMFGLIVVLGILVDDAIVVAENIQARHDRGEASLIGAVRGAEEVAWPVVATVLTTIVAFLPLTFVRGRIGDLLGALPGVVACALLMSLVESLLILPSHMGHSLVHRDRSHPGAVVRTLHRFEAWRDRMILQRVVPGYAWLLERALRARYFTVTIAVSVLIVSLGLLAGGRLGFVFLPSEDSETIVVNLRMSLGTPIERTAEAVARFEAAARAQDETRSVAAVIGQQSNLETGAVEAYASHLAELFVELRPVEQRERASSDVIDSIRQAVGTIPEAERVDYQEITGGPAGADITVEVRGPEQAEVVAAAAEVKAALADYEGVHDIFDDDTLGQRELQIRLRPSAAALGLSVSDVAEQVRGTLFGLDAHVFSEREEDIDVRVRLDEGTRRNLRAIEQIWITTPSGGQVPLIEVAELRDGFSYATIKRIDRERAVTVTAETVPELSPERVTGDFARNALPRLRARHPRVTIELAGRQQQMADAFGSLPLGFLAALIMIYVILAWLFSSYTQPIAVMLAIPFGLIGVIAGHLLLGFDLTFLSLIGFVALSGIVVNDSLIFMQFYNDRRREGAGIVDGLIAAGRQRLRPIFLTTVTTVLGLTPLMLEQSFQARFLIPMAISISFGLMSATGLVLLVLPSIVVIVDDLRRAAYFCWHGRPRPERATGAETVPDLLG